tara:strand:+ start:592 stop:786 length:195 start_codon:yes stop_codon:yes gene_type:complete
VIYKFGGKMHKLTTWVLIISGLFLIVEGISSILIFQQQPNFYHITRLIRIVIGIGAIVIGFMED